MLNLKQKKCLVCALTMLFLLSMAAASCAHAREEDLTPPPAVDDNGQPSEDTPVLIMTLDGNVTSPEDAGNPPDEPNLYQTQDIPATVNDNSTREVTTQEDPTGGAEDNKLIATLDTASSTPLIVGCTGLLAAVAAIGAFIVVRKRKSD